MPHTPVAPARPDQGGEEVLRPAGTWSALGGCLAAVSSVAPGVLAGAEMPLTHGPLLRWDGTAAAG